ncbi:pseudouridine synthase [Flammeovirgaceae bacterium SG7u.111]|nr:pseudouridine synthase [Flammeovirgaceae bacterium SG7u.132]WPO34340.1 pseudouridine synthase [Flammeovirgaceae bacterium SG7u.111]
MKKRGQYGDKREGGKGKSFPKRGGDPRSKSGDFDNKGKDSYRGESHGRSKSRDFDNDRRDRRQSSRFDNDRPRSRNQGSDRGFNDRRRSGSDDARSGSSFRNDRNRDDRRDDRSRGFDNDRPRSRGNGEKRVFRRRADRDQDRYRARKRSENEGREDSHFSRGEDNQRFNDFDNDRGFNDKRRPGSDDARSRGGFRNDRNRDDRRDSREPRSFGNDRSRFDDRRNGEERGNPKSKFDRKPSNRYSNNKVGSRNRPDYESALNSKRSFNKREDDDKLVSDEIRLNRYISNSGVCSRREADELIANGQIRVNGNVITEMGFKVKKTDKVTYKNKLLSREKPVYILLNKPKGFITTMSDPEGRKTVMDLLQDACEERVYPVGRLDRDTTGLLLLTNDGQLAKDLAHPSGNTKKIYNVELDRPISEPDFNTIVKRELVLEDGPVDLDGISIINTEKTQLGVELHSGKNRIVRRIFEHFGYKIIKLDRTVYAGLTKIDLQRGKWRFLSEKELVRMKHMNIRK